MHPAARSRRAARARAVALPHSLPPQGAWLPWLLLLVALGAALLAAAPARASTDPGDPPPLTPVRDPAPTDPAPPLLTVLG